MAPSQHGFLSWEGELDIGRVARQEKGPLVLELGMDPWSVPGHRLSSLQSHPGAGMSSSSLFLSHPEMAPALSFWGAAMG